MRRFHPPRLAWRCGLALAVLAALGSCSGRAPVPVPTPMPTHTPVVRPSPLPPPPPRDWRDAAQTPGTWTWAMVGGRSTASYGLAGQTPLARLSCDRAAAQVVLSRASASTGQQPMAVYATDATRSFTASPQAGEMAVALSVRDPLLEAIAFSRGRFALDLAGEATLYLPSWPELSRVIEDCR